MIAAHRKICDVIAEAEIGHIFGIPGGGTMRIFDTLYDYTDKIQTILVRHEQAASIMADMYGRLTGKPGIVMGQGAFIGSNAVFGTMEAYLAGSPMLVLADASEGGEFSLNPRNASGWGHYGAFDLRKIFESITKFSVLATTPKEAVIGVQLAMKHATTGRKGPAAVIMRESAISGELDPDRPPRIHPMKYYLKSPTTTPSLEDLLPAIELLRDAQRPVIIAGNGVHASNAHEELIDLAELLASPVATSYNGKSAFHETHPLALGMMGGFGQRVANSVISEADTLLVVGCRLAPNDTNNESPNFIDTNRQKVIQIDIEPKHVGWAYPAEVSLIGDAKAVLRQLLKMGGEILQRSNRETIIAQLQERKKAEAFFENEALYSEQVPIMPQRLVKDLNEALDPSTIITLDAGSNRVWMAHYYKTKGPKTMLVPGGLAGMGWSAPAAVTAKLLYPERPCVSVSGDGGFSMSMHVISTALQYNLPVVFVVMNNSSLGMVATGDLGARSPSDYIDTDFAAIARGFGCEGFRVENPSEIKEAVREALKQEKPTVVDVITEKSESLRSIRGARGYAG
ncbi:MAG: thiamine pyrophosphate-binding protein [Candidatus Tectomicrobia bacterium]|nr:thiamine pyrophosphate-binding protein [Candidatus Tectomicrobia bacterium]